MAKTNYTFLKRQKELEKKKKSEEKLQRKLDKAGPVVDGSPETLRNAEESS